MDGNDPNISADSDLQNLRRRARQQFIGAAVLLLVAVIALPFVFSAKPRPVASDIAIDIKAPATEKPVQPTAPQPPSPAPSAAPASPAALAAPDQAKPTEPVATLPQAAASALATPALVTKPEPATKQAPQSASPPNIKPDDGARAAALLNGSGYQIQAGSFTDKGKVQAIQDKLAKGGFQSTTLDAIAKDGTTHTRIRLGPYPSQAEANSVAARIGKLGIKTIVIKP